jgi:hypothetical protein
MQLALRPVLTAGVALADASLIAVAPVTLPLPDVQVPAVQLTSATGSALGDLTGEIGQIVNTLSGAGGSTGVISDIPIVGSLPSGSGLGSLFSGSGLDSLANLDGLGSLLNLGNAADPFTNPITEWLSVLTTAFGNIQTLGQTFLADPFPILSAVIDNQIAYAQLLGDGLQSAGTALVSGLEGLPAVLSTAFTDLLSGDVLDAINGPFGYLFSSLLDVGIGPLEALVQVLGDVGTNIDGVLSGIGTPLLLLVLAPIYPLAAVVGQFAFTAQDFVTSVSTGDFVQAFSDVINAPAYLTGAFLNGTDVSPITDAGLLTSPFGFFANLLDIRTTIASDITPFDPASSASVADPSITSDIAGILNPATAVSDLSGMLSGADLSGLLDLGGLSALSALPADLGTMLLSLIP